MVEKLVGKIEAIKVPSKTPGIPEIKIKNEYSFLKVFLLKCGIEAPIPNAKLATLCVANALGKGKPKNKRAGSCISPAPPPDKADIKLEITDIIAKKICDNMSSPNI